MRVRTSSINSLTDSAIFAGNDRYMIERMFRTCVHSMSYWDCCLVSLEAALRSPPEDGSKEELVAAFIEGITIIKAIAGRCRYPQYCCLNKLFLVKSSPL